MSVGIGWIAFISFLILVILLGIAKDADKINKNILVVASACFLIAAAICFR